MTVRVVLIRVGDHRPAGLAVEVGGIRVAPIVDDLRRSTVNRGCRLARQQG